MEKLLDVNGVSDQLNISKRSLEQLLASGEGPRHLLIGRLRRWRRSEVDEWVEQRLRKTFTKEKQPCDVQVRSDMNK